MDAARTPSRLQQEWDISGFLGRLRTGDLDLIALTRLVDVLSEVEPLYETNINGRLVSWLWYMPMFMEWQRERVRDAGGDMVVFEQAVAQVQTLVESILGIP